MKNDDLIHSKIYFFLNITTLLGYTFLYPIISNYINPASYGEYIILHTILALLVNVSNLGCIIGYRRNFFEKDEKKFQDNLLFSCQIFIFIILVCLFFLFLIFGNIILSYFNVSSELKSISSLLLLSLILDSFCKYYLLYLENKKLSKKYSIIFFFKTYLFFLISILSLVLGYGIKSIVYGLFVSNFFLLLVTLYLQLKEKSFNYHFKIKFIQKILIISIPSIPTLIFSKINSDLDKLLIGYFFNVESAGIYSIGQSIAFSIFQIMTSLDKVYIPSLYKMMFKKRIKDIGSYLTSFFFFFAFLSLGLILSTNIIVDFFLKNNYNNCKFIIIIFSFYYLSLFFGKIISHQFIFLKKVKINTYVFFINMGLNIFLSLLAVKYLNIYWIAIATVVSSLISILISYMIIGKKFAVRFSFKIISSIYLFLIIGIALQFFIISSEFTSRYGLQILLIISFMIFFIFYGFNSKIVKRDDINRLYIFK